MNSKGSARDLERRPPDRRLFFLHEIAMELSRAEDLASLCRRAVELCIARMGFDRMSIWLFDLEDPRYMQGTWGTDEEGRPRDEGGRRLLRNPWGPAKVLYEGPSPFVIEREDLLYDDAHGAVGRGDKAIALLWDGERAIGELVADNIFTRRPMSDEDGEVLALVARTVAHLIALKRADAGLKQAIEAKAALLGELRQRTKNSFALVGGLISLEIDEASDSSTAEGLKILKDRVQVLTSLYAHLDETAALERVQLDDYLRTIAGDLMAGYGADARGITLECRMEGLEIDVERAVPLGLIVNELVTDSLKHAFPGSLGGRIALELRREAGRPGVVLSVSDDGVGLPADPSSRPAKGLGLVMVEALCRQISASLKVASGDPGRTRRGVSFELRFEA